jgi:DNA-binding transcriptional regulator YhcF (GntR family)
MIEDNDFWETREEINVNDKSGEIAYRFGQIPLPIMSDPRISDTEQQIYSIILTYHLYYGKAFPSQTTIALMTKRSRETVNRTIKHMEDVGLLRRVSRGSGLTRTMQVAKMSSLYPFLTQEHLRDSSYFLDNKRQFLQDLTKWVSSFGGNMDTMTSDTESQGSDIESQGSVIGSQESCSNVTQRVIHNNKSNGIKETRAEINFDPDSLPDVFSREIGSRTKTGLSSNEEAPHKTPKKETAPVASRQTPAQDVIAKAKAKTSAARAARKARKSIPSPMQAFGRESENKATQAKPQSAVSAYQIWQKEMGKIGFDQSARKYSKSDLSKLKRLIEQNGYSRLENMIKYACNGWDKIKKENWIFKEVVAPSIGILTTEKNADSLFLMMDRDNASFGSDEDYGDDANPWGFMDKK